MTSLSIDRADAMGMALSASPPLHTATVAMTTRAILHARASGRVVSDDGALALVVRSPADPDEHEAGASAEQLFAAGLATSFQGALRMAALTRGIQLLGSIDIVASVHLTRDTCEAGPSMSAELEVSLPPLSSDVTDWLMSEAERICAYAKMMRSGIRSSFILR